MQDKRTFTVTFRLSDKEYKQLQKDIKAYNSFMGLDFKLNKSNYIKRALKAMRGSLV